jgi:hypothetical protein
VGVGEEGELQRRNRALDRHLGDVDDQAATGEGVQPLTQSQRTLEGVELVDALAPLGAVQHAGRLVRPRLGAGCDDEVLVAELAAVDELHETLTRFHARDRALHQVDIVGDELLGRFRHVLRPARAEGEEQVARLVVVPVARLDHRDLPARPEPAPQLVDHHRPGRASSQDHHVPHVGSSSLPYV